MVLGYRLCPLFHSFSLLLFLNRDLAIELADRYLELSQCFLGYVDCDAENCSKAVGEKKFLNSSSVEEVDCAL
jgi:hypothetical protein